MIVIFIPHVLKDADIVLLKKLHELSVSLQTLIIIASSNTMNNCQIFAFVSLETGFRKTNFEVISMNGRIRQSWNYRFFQNLTFVIENHQILGMVGEDCLQ
jgi:hypothetical protein